MSKPDVTIGTATKRADFLNLVKYVDRGDTIDGSAGDTTLTASDFGRTIVINSSSARAVNLPSVGSEEIGGWFRIVKLGTGPVTVSAADGDTIMGGAVGGSLVNTTANQSSSVIIRLVTASAWILDGGAGWWANSVTTYYLAPAGNEKPALSGVTLNNEETLKEISAPATPAGGYVHLYAKTDKRLYHKDSNGLESQIVASAEVLPAGCLRRWAAARASSQAYLQALVDLYEDGSGMTTFLSTVPSYARITPLNSPNSYRTLYARNDSLRTNQANNFDISFRIKYETTTNIRTWVGLMDTQPADNGDNPAGFNIAAFRFSTAVGGNIYAVTKNGTTIEAVSTGVAAANSWFSLRIVGYGGGVDFYVNGVKTNTLITNLPSGGLFPVVHTMTLAVAYAYINFGSFSCLFDG